MMHQQSSLHCMWPLCTNACPSGLPCRCWVWCTGKECDVIQDIAVVPFLVLLPLVENADLAGQHGQSTMTLVASLGPTALQTLLGLGALLLGGRVVLRRIFEMVGHFFLDGHDVPMGSCFAVILGPFNGRRQPRRLLWQQLCKTQLCTVIVSLRPACMAGKIYDTIRSHPSVQRGFQSLTAEHC